MDVKNKSQRMYQIPCQKKECNKYQKPTKNKKQAIKNRRSNKWTSGRSTPLNPIIFPYLGHFIF